MDHLVLADPGADGGQLIEVRVERDDAERVLKEDRRHADRADGARDGRRNRHAVDAAASRQRSVGDDDDVGGAALFEIADHHRAEIGERRLRPVDGRQPVARLPVAQADEVEPRPVEQAAMLADRELAHPAKDEQLDFGQLRQVDERLDVLFACVLTEVGTPFR
jgi:hypothetical protein